MLVDGAPLISRSFDVSAGGVCPGQELSEVLEPTLRDLQDEHVEALAAAT
ncbi:MAG: hypothetical protein GY835_24190 [bacterium]|nr:hypothetical protein [bacterium]